jgi:hypothetical protein
MTASRITAVYLAAESTYGVDPDSDGSDYLPIRFDGVADPVDATEIEEVGNASGRNEPAELQVTRSGAKLSLTIPLYGYAAGSGDGDAAPTADVLDLLLANVCGTALQATGGEGVNSGSAASTLVLDASIAGLVVGTLVPVYLGASDTPVRTHWRRIGNAASAPTYSVVPDWSSTPTTAAIMYGVRGYGQANNLQTATVGLAAIVNRGGTLHRLLGGRITSMSLDLTAGKVARMSVGLSFDSYEEGATAASLPAITTYPSPIIQTLAPCYWGATQVPYKSIKIDMRPKVVEVQSAAGTNGRGQMEVVEIDPLVTIDPAWAPSTWNSAFQAGQSAELLVQIGGGYTASGRPNTMAFHARRAQINTAPTIVDDGGYLRNAVSMVALGSGLSGTYRWMLARC